MLLKRGIPETLQTRFTSWLVNVFVTLVIKTASVLIFLFALLLGHLCVFRTVMSSSESLNNAPENENVAFSFVRGGLVI